MRRRARRCFTPIRCSCAATIFWACRDRTTPGKPPSFGTGWPSNGGGRLVGSLAGLPYALAEAEQNFLIPSQTQALIWGDLVPQMILSAKIPRWWNVTPRADALGGAADALCEIVNWRSAAVDAGLAAAGAGRVEQAAPRPRARSRWAVCWKHGDVARRAGTGHAIGTFPDGRGTERGASNEDDPSRSPRCAPSPRRSRRG